MAPEAAQSSPGPEREAAPRGHSKSALVCQVEGCQAHLKTLRDYHKRYKICEHHLRIGSIERNGEKQRFCQQCGRFHCLTEFDLGKRSCRARLKRHNARRRQKAAKAMSLAAAATKVTAGPRASSRRASAATTDSDTASQEQAVVVHSTGSEAMSAGRRPRSSRSAETNNSQGGNADDAVASPRPAGGLEGALSELLQRGEGPQPPPADRGVSLEVIQAFLNNGRPASAASDRAEMSVEAALAADTAPGLPPMSDGRLATSSGPTAADVRMSGGLNSFGLSAPNPFCGEPLAPDGGFGETQFVGGFGAGGFGVGGFGGGASSFPLPPPLGPAGAPRLASQLLGGSLVSLDCLSGGGSSLLPPSSAGLPGLSTAGMILQSCSSAPPGHYGAAFPPLSDAGRHLSGASSAVTAVHGFDVLSSPSDANTCILQEARMLLGSFERGCQTGGAAMLPNHSAPLFDCIPPQPQPKPQAQAMLNSVLDPVLQ